MGLGYRQWRRQGNKQEENTWKLKQFRTQIYKRGILSFLWREHLSEL